jgi:hypothetical protein
MTPRYNRCVHVSEPLKIILREIAANSDQRLNRCENMRPKNKSHLTVTPALTTDLPFDTMESRT